MNRRAILAAVPALLLGKSVATKAYPANKWPPILAGINLATEPDKLVWTVTHYDGFGGAKTRIISKEEFEGCAEKSGGTWFKVIPSNGARA